MEDEVKAECVDPRGFAGLLKTINVSLSVSPQQVGETHQRAVGHRRMEVRRGAAIARRAPTKRGCNGLAATTVGRRKVLALFG